VILPTSRPGYSRMCQLLTRGHTRGEKGQAWVTPAEVAEHACEEQVVLIRSPPLLDSLREAFDHAYAYVARHRAPGEAAREALLRERAEKLDVPLVAGTEVLYHHADRRELQDVVTCIRHGCRLTEAGRRLEPNAEHALRTDAEMHTLFADLPDALARTLEIAERCRFSLDQLRYVYPAERLPDGEDEKSWLRKLTWRGAEGRYPEGIPDDVRAQLERELTLIEDLDYGGYFLTMHEIVEYCRQNQILCQGRGSAANSAVCFVLGITAVDPVRMDLLFERFLSRERAEPPDIDLDIEHERREEVIQHVYERYGRRHAAMVCNCIRYRARSAIREVGKVLGVPDTDLDGVCRLLNFWSGNLAEEVMKDAGMDPSTPGAKHLLTRASELLEAPRHLSIHPGGFLLGHLPVDHLVPIEPATMEDRTVIQWNKYDVDDLGLFKVDLLGLGTLSCLRRGFDLLREHDDVDLDIATIPAEDPATYQMCSEADTVGVFQIESRAQQAMLPRLRPRTFYDLVIEVAIVRPGPIQGNMVHPYLRRRHGEEPVEYPHPDAERVLAKTLGVPIFQEQVMKLAVLIAGYSPGEADQLRRDMAAWRRSGRIEKHFHRMVPAMVRHGVTPEFAKRVFDQIRGFGEYGFPESHAASFALLAYATAWMKCHHPAVFSCALLNSQPMGFYSPATIVEDVKRHGVEVRPLDVLRSAWDCTLEPAEEGHAIRMGLRMVKGLGERERKLLEEVAKGPPVRSLPDFVRRSKLSARALLGMAEAGVFESLGIGRRDALWQIRGLVRSQRDSLEGLAPTTQLSFQDLEEDDAILWDYAAADHSTRGHPIARFREVLEARGILRAVDLLEVPRGKRVSTVGQVICRQRPGSASGVNFYTLEDETGFAKLVLWARVAEKFRIVAKTQTVLGATGVIERAENVTHLIVDRLWALPDELRRSAVKRPSRDFH